MAKKFSFDVNSDTGNEKVAYEPPRQLVQYAGACTASMSAFAIGNILGWTSPAGPQLKAGAAGYFPVNDYQNAWIGGIMPIGGAIACLPAGYFTDKFGRKNTMLGLVPLFLLSWGLIIWATSIDMIYAGRFIGGLVCGAVSLVAPVYTAEICQKEIRGALGSYYQLFIAGGIMFVYVIGSCSDVFWISVVCGIVPIIFGIIMLFFPDTPVFYLTKGQPEEARKSLRFFRGPNYDLESELCELAEGCTQDQKSDEPLWKSFTTKQAIKALWLSVGMQLFQQLSGINAFIFYTVKIFKDAGSTLNPSYATIIVGFMEVFSTYCMTFVVDRLGRVILLTTSALIMAICAFIMGIYFHLKEHDFDVSHIGWLPLVAICVFIIVFSIGYGPVPWAVMPEIIPARIKGAASSIACVANWVCCFIVTKCFSDLTNTFGTDVTFWIFTVINILGTIFSWKCIPETKGKSFEEIQKQLGGESPEAESRI